MASAKLRRAMSGEGEEMKMDMSPMIDLVFLLLIFFMVSSHMIIVEIDKEVKPPTAAEAQVAKNTEGRIVVNIYKDGSFHGPKKGMDFLTADAVSEYVDAERQKNDESRVKSRLHLRADKRVTTRYIKEVVKAAADALVVDVIFGAFVVEKD
ncbi:MAG: biopolymer transporter ExbD [Verrucomicrobia bacterium]|nr:biopolymer transporter ExbD [Verrucomicrobiota bacterium]